MKPGTIFKFNGNSKFIIKIDGIRVLSNKDLEYYGEADYDLKIGQYGIIISSSKIDVDWFVFLNNKIGALREKSMEILG